MKPIKINLLGLVAPILLLSPQLSTLVCANDNAVIAGGGFNTIQALLTAPRSVSNQQGAMWMGSPTFQRALTSLPGRDEWI